LIEFKNIKAVGFDLDGTLVDSRIAYARAFEKIIESWELKSKTMEELCSLVGIHLHELLEKLGLQVSDKQKFLDEIDRIYPGIADREMKVFDGARELLQNLKARNIKIALITSNSSYGAKMSLEICGISDYFFDEIITSCNTENHKPHPEPILKAIKNFSVNSDEFIYFGDTTADYSAAMKAGVRFKLLTHNEGCTHNENICASYHIDNFKLVDHYLNKSFL
jgi:HAD superfamily hydrolase (TIGR01509 family)